MSAQPMRLISHPLCPYVQRALIVAWEKGVDLMRMDIDLARKPDWFLALSPTGKTPLLQVGGEALFESAAICEYLDEIAPNRLHPEDPLRRARHRGWIEFASGMLGDIAGLYGAPDAAAFEAKRSALAGRIAQLERAVAGPWFDGDSFSLVDAAFAPAFRYFDVLDRNVRLGLFDAAPRVDDWRAALAARPSVILAVARDYPARLETFFRGRGSHLSRLMARAA
jgi:glutathione S-transferase